MPFCNSRDKLSEGSFPLKSGSYLLVESKDQNAGDSANGFTMICSYINDKI